MKKLVLFTCLSLLLTAATSVALASDVGKYKVSKTECDVSADHLAFASTVEVVNHSPEAICLVTFDVTASAELTRNELITPKKFVNTLIDPGSARCCLRESTWCKGDLKINAPPYIAVRQ